MRPFNVFVPSVNSNYASFGRACARGYANARGISIAEEEAGQQTLQVASCSQQLLSLPALVSLFFSALSSPAAFRGRKRSLRESLGKLL